MITDLVLQMYIAIVIKIIYLKLTLTEQQQRKMMKNPSIVPAIPTIHVTRMNMSTPKMFWIVGK